MNKHVLAAVLALTLYLIAWPLRVYAQEPLPNLTPMTINTLSEPQPDGTTRLSMYFTIKDQQGNPVTEEVIEQSGILHLLDDQAQPVPTTVEQPTTPIKIVLLLDGSGSMIRVIDRVRDAAKQAVDAAPANAQIAVFRFTRVTVDGLFFPVQDFTTNKDLIKQAIDAIQVEPDGMTCLYNAAYRAIDNLAANTPNPQDRRAVLVFTDGIDSVGVDRKGRNIGCSERTAEHVITRAQAQPPTSIHVIGLGNVDRQALEHIATETAGFATFSDENQLEQAFGKIMAGLQSQWVARVSVCAAQGTHNAVLRIPLRDQLISLSQNITFTAVNDCRPAPVIRIDTPQYNRDLDRYSTALNITHPTSIGALTVWTVERQGQSFVRVRAQDVPLAPAAGVDALTLPHTEAAENGDPTQSLERGRDYCFWVKATDIAGQPIKRTGTILGADETVLAEACVGTYEPRFTATILSAIPSANGQMLHILLDVRNVGQRSLIVEANITDENNQPVAPPNRITPENIRDFTIPLPEAVQRMSEPTIFILKLRLLAGEQSLAHEQAFTIVPPPRQPWITPAMLMVVSLLLLMVTLVAWFSYRRTRTRSTALPPPSDPTGDNLPTPPETTVPSTATPGLPSSVQPDTARSSMPSTPLDSAPATLRGPADAETTS